MDHLAGNLRHTLRSWARQPILTLVALLALTLGIGANSAIFSVVYGVLVRPLPYPEAGRLMTVWMDNRLQGWPQDVTSYPNYRDWRDRSETFEDMAAISTSRDTITGLAEPERVLALRVTPTFFDVLGVEPLLGRGFSAADWERDERLVVLSYGSWQRRFGGDESIIGATLDLGGTPHTVIGVMPAGFHYRNEEVQHWRLFSTDVRESSRGRYWLEVAGRLRAGVTLDQARSDLDRVGALLEREYPDQNSGYGVTIVPLYDQIVGDVRPALLVLLGAAGLVLLICCANVANLMLVRATARRREMAVRAALGANRRRLLAQTLTESVALALVGGILGLGLAWGGVGFLRGAAPDLPRIAEVALSTPVLLFALLTAAITGIVFGLAPAMQVAMTNLASAIGDRGAGDESRGVGRLRAGLVAGELAVALVLLIGAGLLLRSYAALVGAGPGFDPQGLLTFQLSLGGPAYETRESVQALFDKVIERTAALPGATATAGVATLPLGGGYASGFFTVEGAPPVPRAERKEVKTNIVTAGYFETMRIGTVYGRTFAPADAVSSELLLVVNDAFARTFLSDGDPLGRRFLYGSPERYVDPDDLDRELPWFRIIGVVEGVRQRGLDRAIDPEVFALSAQAPRPTMSIIVRTEGDPASLASAVRQAVWSVDPNLPVSRLDAMTEVLGSSTSTRRFNATLLGLFSFVALVLAATGLYGVMSYWVSRQTREIGVRMALGARGANVMGLILRRTGAITAVGLGLGIVLALGLTRLMSSLLYGVGSHDPTTFAAVAALLGAIATIAALVPAWRAARVDPVRALRSN